MQYISQTTMRDGGVDPQIGIYGWRKRCLYALLLGLLVVVLCNLVATLLLLNILHFNLGGLGDLSITTDGVRVRDFSYVLDTLMTSSLFSRRGRPLSFETSYNMSLSTHNLTGQPTQAIHFWSATQEPKLHELSVSAQEFIVNDQRGRAIFTVEDGLVTVGADKLRVLEGGVHFKGSVQTSMLKSDLGSELMLESATRRLFLAGASGVSIESRAADISASCLTDLELLSLNGKVSMKSPGIYIPNLARITLLRPQPSGYFQSKPSSSTFKTYQVCICKTGKLFVSKSDGECSVDNDGRQCR